MPQVKELAHNIRDAMDGKTDGILHLLEGLVEPELIEETQQELIRFRSALKDIIKKMQKIALLAASQAEKKFDGIKENTLDVAHNLQE